MPKKRMPDMPSMAEMWGVDKPKTAVEFENEARDRAAIDALHDQDLRAVAEEDYDLDSLSDEERQLIGLPPKDTKGRTAKRK